MELVPLCCPVVQSGLNEEGWLIYLCRADVFVHHGGAQPVPAVAEEEGESHGAGEEEVDPGSCVAGTAQGIADSDSEGVGGGAIEDRAVLGSGWWCEDEKSGCGDVLSFEVFEDVLGEVLFLDRDVDADGEVFYPTGPGRCPIPTDAASKRPTAVRRSRGCPRAPDPPPTGRWPYVRPRVHAITAAASAPSTQLSATQGGCGRGPAR